MIASLKDSLKKALYYTGYYSLREAISSPTANRLLILMFHNIVTDAEKKSCWYKSTTFTCNQMERILSTLQRHYRVITVEDAMAEIAADGRLLEKSAAITFDDAYQSTYDFLFPMLKRRKISCTIYVPTGWIDGTWTPWWMQLTAMIDKCPNLVGAVGAIERILGRPIPLSAAPAEGQDGIRRNVSECVEGVLMRQSDEQREEILSQLRDVMVGSATLDSSIAVPLTWAQIKEMHDYGVNFGAHTHLHPNLSFVNLETAEQEFSESRRILELHLGKMSIGCAYPYGYDVAGYQRFTSLLERLGFAYACTSWPGYVDHTTNRYLLGRIGLPLTASKAIIARTLSLEYLAG